MKFAAYVVIVFGIFLSGCQYYNAVQTAAGVYQSGKAVSTGYGAYSMMKSLQDAEPIFKDYDYIAVESLISPRQDDKSKALVKAFAENLQYIIKTDLAQVGTKTRLCENMPCGDGSVIKVQFKEKGYDESIVQHIFMGDKLKGNLYYIDVKSGSVIREESLESMDTYEDMLRMIHTVTSAKLIKQSQSQEEAQTAMDKLNAVDPIMPAHKELFASN